MKVEMNKYSTIIKRYKYMFTLMDVKKPRYPISFGFECGMGWFDILSNLFDKMAEIDTKQELTIFQVKEKFGTLQVYINNYPSPSRIDKAIEWTLNKYNKFVRFFVNTFKLDKLFNEINFHKLYTYYIPRKQRQIQKIIDRAEDLSARTCECCGNRETAELRSDGGWVHCICESCQNPTPTSDWQRFEDVMPSLGSKIEYKSSIDSPYPYIGVFCDGMGVSEKSDYVWRYIK